MLKRSKIKKLCFFGVLPLLVCIGITYADDFDSPRLKEEWTWDDPDGDDEYSLTEESGWFRFYSKAGENNIWAQNRSGTPMLLRRAPKGDYSIETHVKIDNQKEFTIAALTVYKAPGEWIQLELIRNPQCDGFWVQYWPKVAGTTAGKCVTHPEPDEAYLKIVKTGDDWEFLYKEKESDDWETLDTVTQHYDLPVQVGFVAKAWQNNDLVCDFDYFYCPELGEVQAVQPYSKLAVTWANIKVAY